MFQEAVVKSRTWESKRGTSSWCTEKKSGLSDSRFGIISYCTQREACEFTLNINMRKWSFSGLGSCLGGSNGGKHKVTKRRAFNPSLVPEPELWKECQQMHGNNVLCCQRGCTAALSSHVNQSPRDCYRDLPHHTETNWIHKNMGGEKKKSLMIQDGQKFPYC